MQKIFFIFGITVLCLATQLLWAQVLGAAFVPNFVLIAVVFFSLYRGLRYSLGAAFLGGLFLDGFSGSTLGINVFSLVTCAFLTGMLKMYIYQPGVVSTRVLLVFVVAVADSFLQYFINLGIRFDIGFGDALVRAIIPEILLTTLVASVTLERLKQCALKLFA